MRFAFVGGFFRLPTAWFAIIAPICRSARQFAGLTLPTQVIQVGDVTNVVSLSRRVLEKRFRRILGRSILEEIRFTQIEHIAKMLIETNLSASSIALSLGYSGVEHLARYFRKQKGMAPIAFRKHYGST